MKIGEWRIARLNTDLAVGRTTERITSPLFINIWGDHLFVGRKNKPSIRVKI